MAVIVILFAMLVAHVWVMVALGRTPARDPLEANVKGVVIFVLGLMVGYLLYHLGTAVLARLTPV